MLVFFISCDNLDYFHSSNKGDSEQNDESSAFALGNGDPYDGKATIFYNYNSETCVQLGFNSEVIFQKIEQQSSKYYLIWDNCEQVNKKEVQVESVHLESDKEDYLVYRSKLFERMKNNYFDQNSFHPFRMYCVGFDPSGRSNVKQFILMQQVELNLFMIKYDNYMEQVGNNRINAQIISDSSDAKAIVFEERQKGYTFKLTLFQENEESHADWQYQIEDKTYQASGFCNTSGSINLE